MGFKAKARKHRQQDSSSKDNRKKKSTQGELSCAINGCDKFADKSLGGRSLSLDHALDVWGQGNFTAVKGRVRVCTPGSRIWKKENKNEDTY